MKIITTSTLLKKARSFIKLAGALAISGTIIGCSLGNPYEHTADRNDIITLGDSIFDLNGQIQENLETMAGETFRDYTRSGAELQGGILAPSVVAQYAAANEANSDIDIIVMNGGGNDILIPAKLFDPYRCRTHWYRPNISNNCIHLIENIYVDGVNLLNQMAADGIQNIVYLGYYELPRDNANLNKAVSFGVDYLGYACDTATVANCQFVDSRGTIPASQIESDDIHPTPEASANLAAQIWPVLEPLL